MAMETILVVSFAEVDGTLGRSAAEAVSCARTVRDVVGEAVLVAGLAGEKVDPGVTQLESGGLDRILVVESEHLAQSRYGSDSAALEAVCRSVNATIVVAPGTVRVNRVLAGVAYRLKGRIDTHVCEAGGTAGRLDISRWFYRQRMKAQITRAHRPWFIACDPGVFEPWKGESVPTSVERLEIRLPETSGRTRVEGLKESAAGEQTIRPDADLLFVAGAGWTKAQSDSQAKVEEAERLILNFLRKSKASLGGSKSMVDLSGEGQKVLSFMTQLNQIGQTGSSPRHPKGLSTCCHGEEPHVVGWRFVNERRAINTDPNCGWAQGKADVLYVADAFAVMAMVNQFLLED
jgi:electron transfer flavoprotein alpha subunit